MSTSINITPSNNVVYLQDQNSKITITDNVKNEVVEVIQPITQVVDVSSQGIFGPRGNDGTSGTSGTSGIDGTSGTSGTSGTAGTSGTSFESPYVGNVIISGGLDVTGSGNFGNNNFLIGSNGPAGPVFEFDNGPTTYSSQLIFRPTGNPAYNYNYWGSIRFNPANESGLTLLAGNYKDNIIFGKGTLTQTNPTAFGKMNVAGLRLQTSYLQSIADAEEKLHVVGNAKITGFITASGNLITEANITASGHVSASTYYGDGSNLTGIETDPFPYTGSAAISGSLNVIGDITGSGKLNLDTNNSVVIGDNTTNGGSDVVIGKNAKGNGTGIAIGYNAWARSYNSVAIGRDATAGGTYNVSIGWYANQGASTGFNSVYIGYNTGRGNNNSNNTIVGGRALYFTDGENNVVMGKGALDGGGSGNDRNVVLGNNAGTRGSDNVLIGYQAGLGQDISNKLIITNTGSKALITGDFVEETLHISGTLSLNDGNDNTVIGDTNPSLSNVATRNTLIGYKAGHYLESGSDNVFIGYEAGVSESIVGSFNSRDNVAIGPYALSNNDYGTSHIAIGKNALKNVTRNAANIAIGNGAGQNLSGNVGENIFIGSTGPSGGSQTIAIGRDAVAGNSSGQNIGIGLNAARFSGGSHNLVIGYSAGYNGLGGNTTVLGNFAAYFYQGNSIVALGYRAGNNGVGNNSIIIGKEAGYYASGSDNIIIGHQAGYNLTGSNQLIIANNSSSALITGDFVEETLDISGSVTITDTVTAVTGSFSHLKGNSPITVQDPVIFQHDQGLDVLGNATIHSINEVELQTISRDISYTSSINITEIASSVNGMIIDYRLTNLNSGSRVGTFMYTHDGTELSYNDLTIPGGGIGSDPILSATLTGSIVSLDIENAAGFNFTGYAKKFNQLGAPVPIANPNAPIPLLDTYPNAEAAFSLRKLSTLHTGSAIRVREDGFDTEIDIGFDINNNLDTSTLSAHCGSNNGYVVTWYDQSGNNNDATQTVASNQPQIVSNGNVIFEGGNPAIQGTNSSKLLLNSTIELSSEFSHFTLCTTAGTDNPWGGDASGAETTTWVYFSNINTNWRLINPTGLYSYDIPNIPAGTLVLQNHIRSTNNSTPLYLNGDTDFSSPTVNGTFYVKAIMGSNWFNYAGRAQEIIFYKSDQSLNRTGIENNINTHYDIYDTGFLADYPGAAAAYSVRQLTTAYTGPALRIREDGTNTETDIGFNSNGDLDTASIASHCGANNGYVTIWYDQSGNGNDATQAAANNQPQIYNGTAVVAENGKPAILSANDTFFTMATRLTAVQSVFNVLSPTDFTSHFSSHLLADSNNVQPDMHSGISGIYLTNLYAKSSVINGDHYLNGAIVDLTTTTRSSGQFAVDIIATTNDVIVGSISKDRSFNRSWVGTRQEIIVYETDQSTNISGIQTNVNNYFSIYT